MTIDADSGLPEFDAPPLYETVFGVRFPPLRGWALPHFGVYWNNVRNDFPTCETKDALVGPPGQKSPFPANRFSVQFTTEPQVRCWYLRPDDTRLIQLQHDGFWHNWRKVTLEEDYPRYAKLRPAFEKEWLRFREFLSEEEIGPPEVVECEATYVNHFEKDREWSSVSDLSEVLKWWSSDGPPTTRVAFNAGISHAEYDVDVSLTPAIRKQDSCKIFQFTLTVKGRPESSDVRGVLSWMDGARAAIVTTFADLTTPKMHELWERTR